MPRSDLPLPAPIYAERYHFMVSWGVDRHRRVLEAIFEKRANIAWSDIEAMLLYYGAEISEGRGSRMRFALNGVRAVFHRPHPQKKTRRGAVASMQRFLVEAGIRVERKS